MAQPFQDSELAARTGNPSVWMQAGLPETGPLTTDTSADVCVVGAGIAGLLTALNLTDSGRAVVVLDQGPIAGGESCKSTAQAVTALDDRAYQLEHMHGRDGARLAVESHARAIDELERVANRLRNELGVDCGFARVDGYLVVPPHRAAKKQELLNRELEAARRAGVRGIELTNELPPGWPSGLGPALRFPNQGQFEPVVMLRGVAILVERSGGKVFTGTHVKQFQGGADAHVETDRGPVVRAKHIVVATNTPVNDRVVVHTKQAGYQTYVVSIEVPAGQLPPAMLWDGLWEDDRSYHYVRLRHAGPGANELIVGGEDHKTGQDDGKHDRFACLEEWTRKNFPMATGRVTARWSGEVMEPADGLAFIGRNPADRDNMYIVTGDSGNGVTHGAIAGMLLHDLILHRDNSWAKLYDPARKIGLSSLGTYTKENINTAAQYADWLRGGEARNEDEIPAGSGAIISHGLHKLAVYKDADGRCTRLSATCTHLGCVVRWNAEEKSWDCPCHGSRFAADGRAMHGPAISGLKPAEPPRAEQPVGTVEMRPTVGVRPATT